MSDEYTDLSYDNVSNPSNREDDPFATTPSPIKKEGEAKKSRFAAKKKVVANSVLKNRQNTEKKESAKLRQFIRILSETNPLFTDIKDDSTGDSDFKKRILEAFREQKDLVESLSMSWGLNNSVISNRIVISHISKAVSEIISKGKEYNFTKDEILIIGKCISEIHKDRLVFGELLEEELISEDILVNIKASMIKPSINLGKLLDELNVNAAEKKNIYHAFHQITYDLSQDLAFNWDKDAMIEDRESLFVNIMGSCAEVVFTSFKEHIVEILKSDSIVLETSIIWSWMSKLNTEIINNDMGYLDYPETDLYWLKDQLATLIISKLNDIQCSHFNNAQKNSIKGHFLNGIEDAMIASWKEESERKIKYLEEKINSTPDDKKGELIKSEEFRKPMELRGVIDNFNRKTNIDFSLIDSGLDLEKIKRVSSKNFAMFWGLSNAVCKLRV